MIAPTSFARASVARVTPPRLAQRVIDPLWHAGGMALLALAVPLLRLPESVAALMVAAFFLGVTLLHPLNGMTFLFLAVPFFLGETSKSPAFVLLPGLVAVIIARGVWECLQSGSRWSWPHRGPLLFYVAGILLALPLDLKELREDLWVLFSSDLLGLVLKGIPPVSHLNSLQVILVTLLGAGLYVVVVNLRPPRELLGRTVLAFAPVYGGLALLGILKHMGAIPFEGRYLSLSFAQYVTVGDHPHRLTATAWNPDYYAQFLVYGAPWMLALLAGTAWRERLGALALVPGVFALAMTFQRGGYLGFLVEVGLLVVYSVWVRRRAKGDVLWGRPWVWACGLGVLIVSVVVLDAEALGGAILGRVWAIWKLGDANRLHLWGVALGMFSQHPLLGVGTGRFAYFFAQYSSLSPHQFGPFWGTAHSLYLQVLAERGIVGFLGLALWIGALVGDGVRGLRAGAPPTAGLLAAAMVSLGGWLCYSIFQHTLYIWGLHFYFWLLAAFITSLAGSPAPGREVPWRRSLAVGLALGVLAAGAWRVGVVAARPRVVGYEAGFFRWERQPDQTPARWTGRRAAAVLPVGGPTLVLTVSAPLPGIERRPQTLVARLDGGASASVVVPGPEWVELRLPVERPPGHPVLLRLETSYALNPKRLGVSADDRTLGVLMKPPRWE